MKRLFLIATLALASFAGQAQVRNISSDIITVTKDTVVTGDTVILVAGTTIVGIADTINAIKIKLPTGSAIHTGQIYRVTFTKSVTNVTYLSGNVVSAPTAVRVNSGHALNAAKIVAEGGSFGLIYTKATKFWYRVE